MSDFKVGDLVKAVAQSDGWGAISKGDIGTVRNVNYSTLTVDFEGQYNWIGEFHCFELVSDGKFWMVLGDGSGYTKVRHASKNLAVKEAERLANVNSGQKFFVLEAVSASVCNNVKTEDLI